MSGLSRRQFELVLDISSELTFPELRALGKLEEFGERAEGGTWTEKSLSDKGLVNYCNYSLIDGNREHKWRTVDITPLGRLVLEWSRIKWRLREARKNGR